MVKCAGLKIQWLSAFVGSNPTPRMIFKMELRDIFEFGSPKKQEELERIYGETASKWEDVQNWDDVVIKEKKALVSELEEEFRGQEQCPYLKKLDCYFYYCELRAEHLEKTGIFKITNKPEVWSAQYNSQTDHFSMQLWCMCPEERYSKCLDFNRMKFEK